MNTKRIGFIAAIIAATGYGLNPLFALPIYREGMTVDSVLFYRILFASIILAVIMIAKRLSFKVTKAEFVSLSALGGLFAVNSYTLFASLNYMDAGIACTILFIYPVIVAVIMALFFKERASLLTYGCIALSLVGVSMLYNGEGEQTLSATGVVLVLISALAYALYIIVVNKSRASTINPIKVTFYVTAISLILFAVKLNFLADLQSIPSMYAVMNFTGLALITTVLTMVLIAYAANKIGSTLTSIVGCLEPITALIVGILIFDEALTVKIIIGVTLILTSVTLVILKDSIAQLINRK
ncbi:MAG: DMT family transporter [Rikenellaceae bacterium]